MSKTEAPDNPSRWPLPPAALLLLAVTAAVALAWSHVKLLWFDELIELQTDGVGSAREVLRIQRHYPLSLDPALFHLLAHASTRLFGVSAFGMRLPALLGFLLAQLCLYFLVRRIAGRPAGLIALTLPALSGMFFYAAEARPYGLLYGLDAATLLAYQAATRSTHARLPVLVVLALLLAAAGNTHWFGILIAGPLFCAEIVRTAQCKRLDGPLWAGLIAGCCGLALALPLYPAVARYGLHYYNDHTVNLHTLTLCYRVLFVSDLQVGTTAQHLVTAAIVFVALAAIAGTVQNMRRRSIDLPAHEFILLLATCALPLFGFAVALLVTHTMAIRYVFGAGLGFAALLASALAPLLNGRNAQRLLAPVLLLALVSIGIIHIRRERLKSAEILARMQLTPTVRAAVLAAPAVYLQNVFPFAADHWYTADPAVRNRLTLLYSYDQELRLRGRDTNSLTAQNMTHFTGFPTATYESVRARGGHALFIVTPDPWWDWTLDALRNDGAQLRRIGPAFGGEAIDVTFRVK